MGLNALWVRQFRRLRLLRSEVLKIVTFEAATDPSANQFVAASGSVGKYHSPIRQTRLPSFIDGRMQWASCVTLQCQRKSMKLTENEAGMKLKL